MDIPSICGYAILAVGIVVVIIFLILVIIGGVKYFIRDFL